MNNMGKTSIIYGKNEEKYEYYGRFYVKTSKY